MCSCRNQTSHNKLIKGNKALVYIDIINYLLDINNFHTLRIQNCKAESIRKVCLCLETWISSEGMGGAGKGGETITTYQTTHSFVPIECFFFVFSEATDSPIQYIKTTE